MRGLSTLALVLCSLAAASTAQSRCSFRILDPDEVSTEAKGRILVLKASDEGPVLVASVVIASGLSERPVALDPGTYDLELALRGRIMAVVELQVLKGGPPERTVDLFEPSDGVLLTAVIEKEPGEPVPAGTRFVLDLAREGAPFAGARWQHTEVEVMCDATGRFMYGLPAPSDSIEALREYRTWLSVRLRPIDAEPPAERGERLRGYRSLTSASTWDLGVLQTSTLVEPPALRATLQDFDRRFILGLDVDIELVPEEKASPGWFWKGSAIEEPTVELEGFPRDLDEVQLDVLWGMRRWTMSANAGVNPLLVAPPPQVTVTGKVRPPLKGMLDGRMRVLLLHRQGTRYFNRYSSGVWSDDGRFEVRDVDPGEYEIVVENPWGEPAACGNVEIRSDTREQKVGTLEFRGWRMLMLHEPKLTDRIAGANAPARWRFGNVRFLKDGKRVPTRWEVRLLMDELAPGHIRIAIPPGLDIDRWGLEVRVGGVSIRREKFAGLIGKVPRVTVLLDRFKQQLADPRLQVVVVVRRENMAWADGVRVVLDEKRIRDGAWPSLEVFPGEWLVGLEIVHTGHGGMSLVELGTVDAGLAGEEVRFTPHPRKIGAVIESVNLLKDG